jgi:hypothetical protein
MKARTFCSISSKQSAKQPSYKTELKVVPSMAMILDERYSQGGNIGQMPVRCRA